MSQTMTPAVPTATGFPTFAEFFTTLWGYAPHPWQDELARHVQHTGRWPGGVSVPTGLGKTATIDIAVWALAADVAAHGSGGRTQPLRIALGVERRLVVDAAGERAAHIAQVLEDARDEQGVLGQVAGALEQLLPDYARAEGAPVLAVSSLHGGISRAWGQRWERTTGALVVTATMTQLTSRVIFRGVGESISRRRVAAGVLGADCLRLCDEPHLSAPAVHTLIEQGEMVGVGAYAARAPQTVVLGATVPASLRRGDRFIAEGAAQGSPRARPARRLDLVQVEPVSAKTGITDAGRRKALAEEIAAQARAAFVEDKAAREQKRAWTRRHGGGVVVIVSNIALAQAVGAELATGGKVSGVPHRVVTSRLRGCDRRDVALPDPEQVIVATQTLEAGVDYDARVIISDLAPLPSLLQRAGRCNRAGLLGVAQARTVVVLADAALEATAAVYGSEPLEATAQLLLEGGYASLNDVDAEAYDEVWAADPRREPLAPELADLLADTRAHGPWAHLLTGLDHQDRVGVKVVFRDRPELAGLVRPGEAETLELPLWLVQADLKTAKYRQVHRLTAAGELGKVWPTALRPGETVVLPSTGGGQFYQPERGWLIQTGKYAAARDVADVHAGAPALAGLAGGSGGVVDAYAVLRRSDVVGLLAGELEQSEVEPLVSLSPGWTVAPAPGVELADGQPAAVVEIPGLAPRVVASRGGPVRLADHLQQVGTWCAEAALVAGLDSSTVREHVRAGLHHDLGKAWSGFQRVRLNNLTAQPWAKSARGASGSGRDGLGQWRHEAVIASRMQPGLAAYLVATHHGRDLVTGHQGQTHQVMDEGALGGTDPWSLALHEGLMRSADWAASSAPVADSGLELADLELELPLQPEQWEQVLSAAVPIGHTVHRLTGLAAQPVAGALAAYGVLAAVTAAGDDAARLRLGADGVFELATCVPLDGSVDLWDPVYAPFGGVFKNNKVSLARLQEMGPGLRNRVSAWLWTTSTALQQMQGTYRQKWAEFEEKCVKAREVARDKGTKLKLPKEPEELRLGLATALLANNSNPLDVLSAPEPPAHFYQVLGDRQAGWSPGKAAGMDGGDRAYQLQHGAVPLARSAVLAWAGLGQWSWGQAQSPLGAGVTDAGRRSLLTLPLPEQWASVEQIKAMARRGIGEKWVRSEPVSHSWQWDPVG